MISHSHRFIFIHVYKVAGTSVRAALEHYVDGLGPRRRSMNKFARRLIGTDVIKPFHQPLHGHATAREYKDFLGEKYFDYFSFAFVRNPFDWQVSLYEYARQSKSHYQHELHKRMNFEEYIRWRCSEDRNLQRDFIFDNDGSKLVNFVGRFENMNNDFRFACQKIGISCDLPHKKRSARSNASQYYNSETHKLVADAFSADFEEFGYSKELIDVA
ncbi:sulfotransferase family 2 domain-containing protein [Rhizobium sp. PAMB 3174]